jgi:hypothetical protein
MDLQAIHTTLAQAPSRIESAARDVAEKRNALHHARIAAEKARAMATINHQNAKNQMVLSALVETDTSVGEAEAKVIEAHGEWLIAFSKHERAKDEFDAAKKESNLMEAEMRSFPSQRS